eukprot:TRINITY_DN10943_c0_g1_i4.p1 TRINITY_DN10943_c0_g1~~TRINITY_DN10943_c0_g1_i4.p1  ORF type:complete len:241 (+),score=45.31 TRINITY_DN10943_c0_g1_i4:46-723(+)
MAEWDGAPRAVWPPQVWWGDADSLLRLRHWQRKRSVEGLPEITHACNLAASAVRLEEAQRLDDVTYLELEMLDAPHMEPGTGLWSESSRFLRKAVAFVDRAVVAGGVVLVNCWAGQNRSGAVLLAWLLMHRRPASGDPLGFTKVGALELLRGIDSAALNNQKLKDCAYNVVDDVGCIASLPAAADSSWQLDLPVRKLEMRAETPIEEDAGDMDGDPFSMLGGMVD